jgi:hypothetical protein
VKGTLRHVPLPEQPQMDEEGKIMESLDKLSQFSA